MEGAGRKLDPRFLASLERVISERKAHCPRCGYDLSGVPGPRCPECGKHIAHYLRVADTTPWRLPEARRRALALWVGRWVGRVVLLVITLGAVGWCVAVLTGALR